MKVRVRLPSFSQSDNTQAEVLLPTPVPNRAPRWLALAAVYAGLAALLGLFGYRYWLDPHHGVHQIAQLRAEVVAQRHNNDQLEQRNKAVEQDIASLRHGKEAIEERARSELGMIGKNETFVQLVGGSGSSSTSTQ